MQRISLAFILLSSRLKHPSASCYAVVLQSSSQAAKQLFQYISVPLYTHFVYWCAVWLAGWRSCTSAYSAFWLTIDWLTPLNPNVKIQNCLIFKWWTYVAGLQLIFFRLKDSQSVLQWMLSTAFADVVHWSFIGMKRSIQWKSQRKKLRIAHQFLARSLPKSSKMPILFDSKEFPQR